eukprot:gene5174-4744_t
MYAAGIPTFRVVILVPLARLREAINGVREQKLQDVQLDPRGEPNERGRRRREASKRDERHFANGGQWRCESFGGHAVTEDRNGNGCASRDARWGGCEGAQTARRHAMEKAQHGARARNARRGGGERQSGTRRR